MDGASPEKIARNNAVFRDANDEIALAASDHGLRDGRPVPFVCECSDPRCTELIRLTLDEYGRVRSNARWFVHAPGHEAHIPGVVRVLERHTGYLLVEKIGGAGRLAASLGGPSD